MPEKIYDTVIIGGGPAGLTAGIYARRAGLDALLIERVSPGGQVLLTDRIENYPAFPEGIGGPALAGLIEEQARSLGLVIHQEDASSLEIPYPVLRAAGGGMRAEAPVTGESLDEAQKVVRSSAGEHRSLSIVISVGAQFRELGVRGEREFRGKGVSYCATCDAPFFKGEKVVVVGGGNVAVQEALFLTRFVEKLILVHRRDRLRATSILRKRVLENDRVEVAWSSVVREIRGDTVVRAVVIEDLTSGRVQEVPCAGIFVFVGLTPQTAFLKGTLALDEEGYILTDENMETSIEGVFASGDCRRKWLRQIVGACWEGALAASAASHYIERLKGTAY